MDGFHHFFNHAHPAACGAILTASLPFDHLTNMLFAILGSVLSWAFVQLITWSWKKIRG